MAYSSVLSMIFGSVKSVGLGPWFGSVFVNSSKGLVQSLVFGLVDSLRPRLGLVLGYLAIVHFSHWVLNQDQGVYLEL